MKEIQGQLDGRGLKVAVLVSRFNEEHGRNLLRGALRELRRLGVADADVEHISVPGALELPAAAALRLAAGPVDALVALGAVVRGETSHYDLVAGECARGLAELARTTGVPVGFGVLTTENDAQAEERARPDRQDKGGEAARVAVEMAQLRRQLAGSPAREE